VDKQLKDRGTFLAEIKERLLHAQDLMKHSYDANHRDISFEVGDWAWLRLHQRVAAAIKDRSGGKLAPRFYGPFRVEAKVGPVAYRLALPPRAHIHNVFHVGFLKKFVGDPPSAMVPLPPIHDGRVLPTRASVDKARMVRGVWQVRVQWVGQPASDATWEPVPDFTEAYPDFQLEDELFRKEGEVLWTLTWAKHISGNVARGRRRKSWHRQQGHRIRTSWLQASSAGTPD
jgi:hypothetical protein